MHDLNTRIANLAVTFRTQAERAEAEAAGREKARSEDTSTLGFPSNEKPDPAQSRSLAMWWRAHLAAAEKGLILHSPSSPAGLDMSALVPGWYQTMQEAVGQGRLVYPMLDDYGREAYLNPPPGESTADLSKFFRDAVGYRPGSTA